MSSTARSRSSKRHARSSRAIDGPQEVTAMQRLRRRLRLVVVLSGLFLCSAPTALLAQIDTGSISGVVTDQSGAVLPGVTVTITSLTTAQARTAVTNAQGRYQVSALSPSRYSVKAELQGF